MLRKLLTGAALVGVLAATLWFLQDPELSSLVALSAAVVVFLESLRPTPADGIVDSRALVRAAQLARPLLALLIFLGLYKAVLQLKIFSQLDSIQTFLLVVLFLVLTYLLMARVLTPPRHHGSSRSQSVPALANTPPPSIPVAPDPPAPLREPARPTRPSPARLELLKLRVIDGPPEVKTYRRIEFKRSEEKDGHFPLVCIDVQNVGRGLLMIQHLEMDVRRLQIEKERGGGREVVHWEYSVLINQEKESHHIEVGIECEVPPSKSRRLVFVIGHELGYGHYDAIEYIISLRLCFGDHQVLDLGDHRIKIYCPWDFCPLDPLPVRVLGTGARTG